MTLEDRRMLREFATDQTVEFGVRQAEVDRLVKEYGILGRDNLLKIRRENERKALRNNRRGSLMRVIAYEHINAVDLLLKRRGNPRTTAISELKRRVEMIEMALAKLGATA